MIATILTSLKPVLAEQLLVELDALYRTARHLTRDARLAEDIVQEVALKVLQKQDTFRRDKGTFRVWVFAILRNTVTDHFRRSGHQPQLVAWDEQESDLPHGVAVDDTVFAHVLDDEIETALQSLPSEMRTAVLLADIEGFRYREIAQILDWPLGSVMSRLSRARTKLRKQLFMYAQQRGYGS